MKAEDRINEKRNKIRLGWLTKRKKDRKEGFNEVKEALWKHMNNICESKKLEEGGVSVKNAQN